MSHGRKATGGFSLEAKLAAGVFAFLWALTLGGMLYTAYTHAFH